MRCYPNSQAAERLGAANFTVPFALIMAIAILVSASVAADSASANDNAEPSSVGRKGGVPAREVSAPARPKEASSKPAPTPEELEAKEKELDLLLREWERRSSKIQKLSGQHVRDVMVTTFETDARSKGRFYYEAPDKGRIDLEPFPVGKGEESWKKNRHGKPYGLTAGLPERWVCDGKQITAINENDKTFERSSIPKELQGQNIIHGPLPFLFGMPADVARRRFEMTLLKNDVEQAIILAVPKRQEDLQNYSTATIKLDKGKGGKGWYLPLAVKLVQITEAACEENSFHAQSVETMYQFEELEVNSNGIGERVAGFFGKDPFNPSLRGYTQAQPAEARQAGMPEGLRGQLPLPQKPGGRQILDEAATPSPAGKAVLGPRKNPVK